MATMGRRMSRVAAGHASRGGTTICYASSDADGEKPSSILKVLDEEELAVYERLRDAFPSDRVHELVPRFEGVVEANEGQEQRYICIENLLQGFQQPKVLDVKLGIRTFQEAECANSKPRPDLYQRMAALYPTAVLPDEHDVQAVTKHRWMSVRDAQTTISTLGYRIDGMAGYDDRDQDEIDTRLANVRDAEGARDVFKEFTIVAGGSVATALALAATLHASLLKMRGIVRTSPFVASHEFVGSSVLLVADSTGRAGVFWIDFAKTTVLAQSCGGITHESPWVQGNHEDGLFIGVDNLCDSIGKLAGSLASDGTQSLKSLDRSASLKTMSVRMSDVDLLSMLPSMSLRGPAMMSHRPHVLMQPLCRAGNAVVGVATGTARAAGTGTARAGTIVAGAAAKGAAAGVSVAAEVRASTAKAGTLVVDAASTAAATAAAGGASAPRRGSWRLMSRRSPSQLGAGSRSKSQRRRLPMPWLCGRGNLPDDNEPREAVMAC